MEPLSVLHARVLRICGRRHDARVVHAADLKQGYSGARTVRVRIMGRDGTGVALLVGKLGVVASVQDEVSRYEMHVGPRLPQGSFTPLATVVRAGAGSDGGLFYTLAEQYRESLFSLLARDEDAALVTLGLLRDIEKRWTDQAPVADETVGDARRRLQNDDTVVADRLDASLDVGTFEARTHQVRRAIQHGDLHGENILVDEQARPVVIDYPSLLGASASLDPVTLELSLLFHSAASELRGEWPRIDVAGAWSDLDRYLENCPVPRFVKACRAWAWEVANGGREVYGNAYSYAVRQFSYPDVDQNLALSIAIPRRQPLSPPNHSFCRRPISVAKLREHNPNEVP